MSCQEELKSIEAQILAKESSKTSKKRGLSENSKVSCLANEDFKRHTLPYSVKPFRASSYSLKNSGIRGVFEKLIQRSKEKEDVVTSAETTSSQVHSQSISLFLNLKKMAEIRWGDSVLTKQVIEFVEELIYRLEYNAELFGKGVVLSAVIGELICLIDKRPKEVHGLVDKSNLEKSIDRIKIEFLKCLENASTKVQVEFQSHLAANLEDANIAKNVLIATTIAKFLVPSSGSINYAIIPLLLNQFVEGKNSSYAESIKGGLNMLYHSEGLRRMIEEIKLPDDLTSPSREVVRLSLAILKTYPLSDIHARQAAIAALITHMRQGKGGSCFASVIAIEQQHCHPYQAVTDFKDLIHEGMLKRIVDGELKEFPYVFKAGRDGLLEELHFGEKGEILDEASREVFLANSPSLLAAMEVIHETDRQSVLEAVLASLRITQKTFTLDDVILQAFLMKDQGKIDQARLAFASKRGSLLLKAWENALAGMAEGEKSGLLKLALKNSLAWLIRHYAKKEGCVDQLNENKVQERMEALLDRRVHYLYDPSPEQNVESAFVLYFSREGKESPSRWERVDSAEKFSEFLRWLAKTLELQNEEQIASEAAIGLLLKKYHRENVASKLEGGNFAELRFTPWTSFIGNDPKRLMKVYKQLATPLFEEEFTPEDASSLFKSMVMKVHQLKEKKGKNIGCIPLRIQGMHTFSLLPHHKSFRSYLDQDSPYALKFQEKVVEPGIAVSNSLATPLLRRLLFEYANEKWVKSDDRVLFQEKMERLSDRLSLKEFRFSLVEAIRQLSGEESMPKDVLHEIDKKIVESLPSSIKDLWMESVVHFADTNWQMGVEDVHWGIGINPGNGELELFSVLEGGEVHQFLDQNEYVNGRTWELFTS